MNRHWSPGGYSSYRPPSLARLRSQGRALDAAETDDEVRARIGDAAHAGGHPVDPRHTSVADLTTAARGTNASPKSPGFRDAFGPGANGNRPPAWQDTFHSNDGGSGGGSGGVGWRPGGAIEKGKTVSGPGVNALMDWGANADADKVRAGAGTGNTVPTKFGTASSRTASPAEGGENVMRPLVGDQSTGVKHAAPGDDWQQKIMAKHPAIGVAGSPENLAFVAAYKNAMAGQAAGAASGAPGGAPIDPHALADQVMKQVASTPPKGGAPQTPAQQNLSQASNFLDPRAKLAQTPTNFAGKTLPPAAPVTLGGGTSISAPPGAPGADLGNGLNGPSIGGTHPAASTVTTPGGIRIGTPGVPDTGLDATLPPVATTPGWQPGVQNPGGVLAPPGGSVPLAANPPINVPRTGAAEVPPLPAPTSLAGAEAHPPQQNQGWQPKTGAPPPALTGDEAHPPGQPGALDRSAGQTATQAQVNNAGGNVSPVANSPAPPDFHVPDSSGTGPGWKPSQSSPASSTAGNLPTPPAPGAAVPTPTVPKASGAPGTSASAAEGDGMNMSDQEWVDHARTQPGEPAGWTPEAMDKRKKLAGAGAY